MTLIVLLILAGVSLSGLFSEKGLFNRAESAGNRYNEAKAREVLETVLLADGQYEKHSNPLYNQDEFLDELIKSEIPGSDVIEDVAIVGGYAYELDRSVPKIGRYLGLAKDLVFPKVGATVQLATDKKTATITITASEETNGINKIEIWLLGEKIAEYPYDNIKTEITLPYTATQNGRYIIKAYGDLMASTTIEVTGIVASVKFEPNGNDEWKKAHSTVVTIQETADKVVKAKYVWTDSVTTPEDNEFTEEQTFKSGDTITKNDVTGIYYLWTMLETQSGEKIKWRSDGFNLDNNHNGSKLGWQADTLNSIKLWATSTDKESGPDYAEFYLDDNFIAKVEFSSGRAELTCNELSTGYYKLKVIFYDKAGNIATGSLDARTKLYTWNKYNANITYKSTGWIKEKTETKTYGNNWMGLNWGEPYINDSGTWDIPGSDFLLCHWNKEQVQTWRKKGAGYTSDENIAEKYVVDTVGDSSYTYSIYTNTIIEEATSAKGSVIGTVSSKDINDYPNNGGKLGDDGKWYWYIRTADS